MKGKHLRPITDLRNRTKQLVQEVSDSGETIVITQNGTPRVVVLDIRQHDLLREPSRYSSCWRTAKLAREGSSSELLA